MLWLNSAEIDQWHSNAHPTQRWIKGRAIFFSERSCSQHNEAIPPSNPAWRLLWCLQVWDWASRGSCGSGDGSGEFEPQPGEHPIWLGPGVACGPRELVELHRAYHAPQRSRHQRCLGLSCAWKSPETFQILWMFTKGHWVILFDCLFVCYLFFCLFVWLVVCLCPLAYE